MDLSHPLQHFWQNLLLPFSSAIHREKQDSYLVLNRSKGTILGCRVKLAASTWTRLRGLLRLSPRDFGLGSGLWLMPAQSIHTFFMSFPIDAVYLDSKAKVIHVCHQLAPFKMAPLKWGSRSILELPAGMLDQTGTCVGDQLEVRPPDLETQIVILCKKYLAERFRQNER